MSLSRTLLAAVVGLTAACSTIHVGVPTSPAAHPDSSRHFYFGKNYGTEAQFNPATEILNEGFDQLRNDFADRRVLHQKIGPGARNVFQALLHPDSAMRAYRMRNRDIV